MRDKPKGEYKVGPGEVQSPVTRVRTDRAAAVPREVHDRGTPIQPIVIQVPQPPRNDHSNGSRDSRRILDIWATIAVVLISTVLSGTVSVYVASRFLEEYSHRIDRLDLKVEELDQKMREMDLANARLQTQMEVRDD